MCVFLFAFGAMIFSLYACKGKIKGCTDTNAANFSADANEFDNSCRYAADVLEGSWVVKETVQGTTSNYVSNILKVDSFKVRIMDTRSTPGQYSFNVYTVVVDWTKQTFTIPGSTVTGKIINNDSLTSELIYGTGVGIYYVRQTYKRK